METTPMPTGRHHAQHAAPERGYIRLPVWSIGILLTLLVTGVGGYVEMAVRYTTLADAVTSIAAHEAAMDSKLSELAALNTRVTVLEQLAQVRAEQDRNAARASYGPVAP